MSTDNNSPFAPAIAALEAKRAEIDDMLAKLRKMAAEMNGAPGTFASSGSGPLGIPKAAFFSHTIPDATKKFLAMTNKVPQSTKQIADALLEGGMETNAKDFAATVQAILARTAKVDDDIIRIGSDWALADWFPGRPRRRRSPVEKAIDDVVGGEKTAAEAAEALVNGEGDSGKL